MSLSFHSPTKSVRSNTGICANSGIDKKKNRRRLLYESPTEFQHRANGFSHNIIRTKGNGAVTSFNEGLSGKSYVVI